MTTAALDLRLPEPALDDAVRAGLARVEGRLLEAVGQADRLANETSKHLVLAGGKRVRPMLTLIAGHLGDPSRPEILEAAVVVELTHLATLYHDDVMDSAPLRRGAPPARDRAKPPEAARAWRPRWAAERRRRRRRRH